MKKNKAIKEQEVRKCKNKNCQRPLPEGYKHKYCENCRNNQAYVAKKGALAAGGVVLSAGLYIVSKGKFGNIGGKDA